MAKPVRLSHFSDQKGEKLVPVMDPSNPALSTLHTETSIDRLTVGLEPIPLTRS